MTRAFAPQIGVRNLPQLDVNNGHQRIERCPVPAGPSYEQLGNIRPGAFRHGISLPTRSKSREAPFNRRRKMPDRNGDDLPPLPLALLPADVRIPRLASSSGLSSLEAPSSSSAHSRLRN